MKYDYLIVGAGLFGAVFAHEAHKKGKKCLVIEKTVPYLPEDKPTHDIIVNNFTVIQK